MRKLEKEICIEDYTSRIPGLFAYVGTEGDDSGVLHHSYDSIDGCYGHVPANVTIPYSAELFGYDEIGYDSSLQYVEVDSIPDVVGNTGELYLKKEEYIEEVSVYSYYRRYNMVGSSEPVTYPTLMYLYWKYKDSETVPYAFLSFVEDAIGYVHVTRPQEISDQKLYDLVPESFYLSQVYKLFTKYDELSRICAGGCEGLDRKSIDVCCACEKYKRMGGDVFKQYLQNMISLAKSKADALYQNSSALTNYIPSVDTNVFIHASIEDLGYCSCYINELVLGNPVYDGELVTYNDRTYICCLTGDMVKRYIEVQDEYGHWLYDNYTFVKVKDSYYQYNTSQHEYVLYNGVPTDFSESTSGYLNPDTMKLEFDKAHFVLLTDYVTHADSISGYNPGSEAIDGFYYDGNTNGTSYLFGDSNYSDLTCTWQYVAFGGSNPEVTTTQKSEAIVATSNPANMVNVTGDMVEFPEYVVWNDNGINRYYYKQRNVHNSPQGYSFDSYNITGNSDSKLRSLRRFVNYLNDGGFAESPDYGEDWLYYYKVGYVTNIKLECDSVGNILRTTDPPVQYILGSFDKYLVAYGDVITGIERNTTEKTVTFTYVLGCHLKAQLTSITTDGDGNMIYTYSNFRYDDESTDGVIYRETYVYGDGSDLDDTSLLSDDNDFSDYVTLSSYQSFLASTNPDHSNCYYKKFPFSTSVNTTTTIVPIVGTDISYSYQLSEFEITVPNVLDMLNAPIFKKDEFVGVSYEPDVEGEIRIDRGNGASRERHLKLGDVMTVDAMENYSNGGFFNIRNEG